MLQPDQGELLHHAARRPGQAIERRGQGVGALRIADQHHPPPFPVRRVIARDAVEVGGEPFRRPLAPEVAQRVEADHGDPLPGQDGRHVLVEARPAAVARQHHREGVPGRLGRGRAGGGDLDQRQAGQAGRRRRQRRAVVPGEPVVGRQQPPGVVGVQHPAVEVGRLGPQRLGERGAGRGRGGRQQRRVVGRQARIALQVVREVLQVAGRHVAGRQLRLEGRHVDARDHSPMLGQQARELGRGSGPALVARQEQHELARLTRRPVQSHLREPAMRDHLLGAAGQGGEQGEAKDAHESDEPLHRKIAPDAPSPITPSSPRLLPDV